LEQSNKPLRKETEREREREREQEADGLPWWSTSHLSTEQQECSE
jgi:hypothetical protein